MIVENVAFGFTIPDYFLYCFKFPSSGLLLNNFALTTLSDTDGEKFESLYKSINDEEIDELIDDLFLIDNTNKLDCIRELFVTDFIKLFPIISLEFIKLK